MYCVGGPNGSAKWFIQSSNSKHITEFIQQQKPTQSKRQYLPNQQLFDNPMQFNDIDCFFEDNLVYRWIWRMAVVVSTGGVFFFIEKIKKNDFRLNSQKIAQTIEVW